MPLDLWKMKHPYYSEQEDNWVKYRHTYLGGDRFVKTYLQKFSKRESDPDFETRKGITYCPSFAAAALNDIKNSIYQRMAEISRIGGHKSYQEAIGGHNGGVNLKGASMNNFIGQLMLPELLMMGRVGVYVDMPVVDGPLLSDAIDKRPYLYIYTAEQIPAWNTCYVDGEEVLKSVLLHETRDVVDQETGLVTDVEEIARLVQLIPGEGVRVSFYRQEVNNTTGNVASELIEQPKMIKGMKRIPFHIGQITHSLLKDLAGYQVALLNMESADVAYVLRANFPFYYEFFDPRAQTGYIPTSPNGDLDGVAAQKAAEAAKAQEVNVGTMSGRRVPVGSNAPGFIHPSSEPLIASMNKQKQMKDDMRKLVNLALGTMEPKFASAESKGMDDRGLEAGLSYIGLELERVERLIAVSWGEYMGTAPASVKYPRKWSLKTDADRRSEAEQYAELLPTAPSKAYAKEVAKLLANSLLEQKVDDETLKKIYAEIDKAPFISSNAQDIAADLEAGIVDLVTASLARGYNGEEVVAKAKVEHAERLARIAESQAAVAEANAAARGNPDSSGDPKKDAKEEKKESQGKDAKDKDTKPAPGKKTRGEGK